MQISTCIIVSGFDNHLLVQALDCPLFNTEDVQVTAKNSERYVQITIKVNKPDLEPLFNKYLDEGEKPGNSRVRIRIIDSNQFLGT